MPINWNGIKTTGNREYEEDNIALINDSLSYLPPKQRAVVLGTIIEESGGNPLAKSKDGTYQGLLQWGADRYRIQSNDPKVELANQLKYLRNTLSDTTDHVSWTHGGKNSGYKSFKEAYSDFNNSNSSLENAYKGFSFGYVRPKGEWESYNNRVKVAKQVAERIEEKLPVIPAPQIRQRVEVPDALYVAKPPITRSEGGSLKGRSWQDLSMAEKATMMRAAVEEGIYDLPTIKAKYNEFAEGGHIYDGTSEGSQQMKIGHPHYSYDEDGNIKKTSDGKPILNFNVTLPEVVITPDSTKSPGERAVLERYRRQQYDHTHGADTYNALLDGEQTKLAIAKRQNEWNNSAKKKALDYAQAAAAIIGGGADTVSGYPVYGTLKGIRTAQEATTPEEYAEAGLWLAPAMIGGSKKVSAVLGKLNLPISRDMPLKGRTEIPRKIKAKAVNRYTSFINSPEYQNRLQRAGLEDHWDYMKELTDRRINNKGYFPGRVQKIIEEDPKIEGLTNVNPSNPNYGITLREMTFPDFPRHFFSLLAETVDTSC